MRRIHQCLNTKLSEIYKAALVIGELNTKLSSYLPVHLREHFSVGSFNQGCLVLITPDPVWASQLRYHLPELRDDLRTKAGIYQLASIKISVSAGGVIQPFTSKMTFPPLSTKARDTILAGSEQCDYDPLKAALKKLALNLEKKVGS